ncbi:hypothetical protein K503DRAFT_396071 [Rhizopogon vinicolor AM-OR11-026]|uniref:Uncharacterized protein n=1 Tax=Rhizopogon vinicolor AM-OR11-026 TaxID=1314800 RepID=A0A1B7NBD3_9AGAM|nr:hypothetical protein K503DRAFT_396071 [Rhizopogon vinicolor AM-OR11-026]
MFAPAASADVQTLLIHSSRYGYFRCHWGPGYVVCSAGFTVLLFARDRRPRPPRLIRVLAPVFCSKFAFLPATKICSRGQDHDEIIYQGPKFSSENSTSCPNTYELEDSDIVAVIVNATLCNPPWYDLVLLSCGPCPPLMLAMEIHSGTKHSLQSSPARSQ